MAKLASATIIEAQDLYTQSSVPMHKLGQLAYDEFGNRYRYVKAGSSALVTGNLLQEPAEDTQFRSMVVSSAAAIGSKSISCTLGNTATTANMFDGGELVVESGTGIGQHFRIVSHSVTDAAGTATFIVDRPIKIALVASDSNISVRKNSYNGVIAFPTTPTGSAVGIALYAMSASYYGWIQSGGDAVALFDDKTNTAADESAIMPSRDVAGSVTAVLENIAAPVHIGWGREQVSVDSTMGFVKLIID